MGGICSSDEEPKKEQQQQQQQQQPEKNNKKPAPKAAAPAAAAATEPVAEEQPAPAAAAGPQPDRAPRTDLGLKTRNEVNYKVYDADTLSLKGEARDRVRFTGVDAPELKQKEFYAEEGANWLKALIQKDQALILEVDPENERDHYERLIARVFIESEEHGGLVCVNDLLLLNGFAKFYEPNHRDKPGMAKDLREHMLALSMDALKRRVGVWSVFEDGPCVKTSHGGSFHTRECEHVADIRHLTELQKSEALAMGLSSCRTCHA